MIKIVDNKKILLVGVFLVVLFFSTACAGTQDWEYEGLPGDYKIERINSKTIVLTSDGQTIIDTYVTHFACDNNYIFVKNVDSPSSNPVVMKYIIIVEVNTGTVEHFENESEFENYCKEKSISSDIKWTSIRIVAN